ncbi:MAG: segregation/condensation protein A [Chloroflexi bacterium]|nr:segregation/condensation protein A [Chloroflexota bacterium]
MPYGLPACYVMMPSTARFEVATPIYQGPLDILLSLIERSELDITKLALAQVTNAFLAYVQQLQNHRPDEVSGFLLIAARLMQIKSEALLPRPPSRELGEEDPGEDLVQQLILYKKYKEIARLLRQKEDIGLKTYLRLAPPPRIEGKLDLAGLGKDDLFKAASRVLLFSLRANGLLKAVGPPLVSIKKKILFITSILEQKGKTTFSRLVGNRPKKADIVATFLALLELIKQFQVQAQQARTFSEIEIEPTDKISSQIDYELEFDE